MFIARIPSFNQIAGVKTTLSLPRTINLVCWRFYKYFASNGARFSIRTVVTVAMKLLARLEANGFPGRNCDFFAGARITTDAAFARFDYEYAEAAQLDSIAARQRILHRIKERLNCLLGL